MQSRDDPGFSTMSSIQGVLVYLSTLKIQGLGDEGYLAKLGCTRGRSMSGLSSPTQNNSDGTPRLYRQLQDQL